MPGISEYNALPDTKLPCTSTQAVTARFRLFNLEHWMRGHLLELAVSQSPTYGTDGKTRTEQVAGACETAIQVHLEKLFSYSTRRGPSTIDAILPAWHRSHDNLSANHSHRSCLSCATACFSLQVGLVLVSTFHPLLYFCSSLRKPLPSEHYPNRCFHIIKKRLVRTDTSAWIPKKAS